MNNLILFTNRSGSTIFTDLLAYATGTINLGEGSHSMIRDYNFNTEEHKQTELYKVLSQGNLTRDFHNYRTRGSDHIGFIQEKQKRLELIKNSTIAWTGKEQTEKQTIDYNFIEYCCYNKNTTVYMTHRRDIISQFISKINARYRLEVGRFGSNNESQFIFTNNDTHTRYSEMRIEFRWLNLYVNVFLEQLMLWRILYEKFKPHVKIVSYEDHIKPMKLDSFGISEQHIQKYKQEKQHLVKTPLNIENVIISDDHPKPMVGAWEQSLRYIERHKYLVEI